jgi:hypothetical protein
VPVVVATAMLVVAPSAEALISISAGPGAALSPFDPGKTATASGSLTATDTSLSWTLQAQDAGSGAGSMVASAGGCSGSDHKLTDPLQVNVTSGLGGVTSAGQITLSSSNQTVASASNQLLNAAVLTTNYSQTLPATQVMLAGCVYTITVTYTLQ